MRKLGMPAIYAIKIIEDLQRRGETQEVDWITGEDGSHPTLEEALEWLRTLEPDRDIVNEKATGGEA